MFKRNIDTYTNCDIPLSPYYSFSVCQRLKHLSILSTLLNGGKYFKTSWSLIKQEIATNLLYSTAKSILVGEFSFVFYVSSEISNQK